MEAENTESGGLHLESYEQNDNAGTFRHKLGLIPEEAEGLTEAFKVKLGFNRSDELAEDDDCEYNGDLANIECSMDSGSDSFERFIEQNLNKDAFDDFSKPLNAPILKSLSAEETSSAVFLNSVVISHAIKAFCKDLQSVNNLNKKITNILSLVFKNLSLNESKDAKNKKLMKKKEALSKVLAGLLATIPPDEFQRMQFIVCYGILNKKLRNEIYSQLCLQVMHSENAEVKTQAWVLHILCAGCFLPNKKMIKSYISFLNDVTQDLDVNYAKNIKSLIQRTNLFGPRCHPPNTLELKAAKVLKKIMLPVLLADGRSITVQSDSATIASEICSQISNTINLKDQFGFAIYISIEEKVSSLGNGLDHVMDAIGECEQAHSLSCRWSLFFGKEIFTPWHDAEFDEVASSLIYCQIIKSVQNGEFKFKSDEDLSRFISRRCYVEMGHTANEVIIKSKLDELIPRNLKGAKFDKNKWSKLIFDSFQKMEFTSNKYPKEHVKWSIVEGAQMKWPLQFAALFEVQKVSTSPSLRTNDVVLAISCRGIFLLEEPFKLLCGLHYYEIIEVTSEKGAKGEVPQIIIMPTSGKKWVFKCSNSEIVAKILASFIDGLRRRSRWAVSINDFFLMDHTKDEKDDFRLKQGDIVELLDESSKGLPDDWMYGRCERTNKTNRFPYDCVYIFPTTKKPPNDFLSIFGEMSQKEVRTLPRKRAAVVLKKDTINSKVRQSFI